MENITLHDPASGATAEVLVSLGFNCHRFSIPHRGRQVDLLWRSPTFLSGGDRPSRSGIPILFPFPGRIRGTTFEWEGKTWSIPAGDNFGNAIHGFVYNRPWRLVEQTANRAVGEFQAAVDDAIILQQWPADFRIRVSYEVRGRELVSEIYYENPGTNRLPCGFATHAYFLLPLVERGVPEQTLVTVPASEVWEAEQMLATGRKLPAGGDLNLAGGNPLAGRKFDTYFTHLHADADGKLRTKLTDPTSGRTLTQTFDESFKHCVVYTPGHREAICIEPYTSMADALRLEAAGHATGLQILEPGQSFETTIVLDVDG